MSRDMCCGRNCHKKAKLVVTKKVRTIAKIPMFIYKHGVNTGETKIEYIPTVEEHSEPLCKFHYKKQYYGQSIEAQCVAEIDSSKAPRPRKREFKSRSLAPSTLGFKDDPKDLKNNKWTNSLSTRIK